MNGETDSFCILSDETLSYVQCAGSADRWTVEYRKYNDMKFNHYVIGFKKFLKKKMSVDFSGRKILVKSNEVLSLVDVIEIFERFYHQKGIPERYGLRDIRNNMK